MLLALLLAVSFAPLPASAEEPAAADTANEEVVIKDPAFENRIREALELDENAAITQEVMNSIDSIWIHDVSDISGIRYASNLKYLGIDDSPKGIEEISELDGLVTLRMSEDKRITDLEWLGEKPALKSIDLSWGGLTSLEGLTDEAFPVLEELNCTDCRSLTDISALADYNTGTLKTLSISCGDITDITPLRGYTSLEELKMENVSAAPGQEEGYRETIRSLTGLKYLDMTYCDLTDTDVEAMFAGKDNSSLNKLILNNNSLETAGFCDYLPDQMRVLSLHGNHIKDMDNLQRFTELRTLGLGSNQVTDFTFTAGMAALTTDYVRNAEGTEDFPFEETHIYATKENPVAMQEGRVVVKNPYTGVDGKPVSFENAVVRQGFNEEITVSYDADTNEIILENVQATGNRIEIMAGYDLPVGSSGKAKIGDLYIWLYADEEDPETGDPDEPVVTPPEEEEPEPPVVTPPEEEEPDKPAATPPEEEKPEKPQGEQPENTEQAPAPRTGDADGAALWNRLCAAALISICAVLSVKRRQDPGTRK